MSDPQLPLYNCMRGFVILEPILLSVIVCEVDCAVNVYQKSLYVPAAAQPNGMLLLAVALLKLIFVLLHPVEDTRVPAVAHSFCA